MAKSRYEYETSPRKLEPEIRKKKIRVVEDLPRQDVKISKKQRERQTKLTLFVIALFVLLLTISYRTSQINEKFNKVQSLKRELSSLQKENEQLKISIENSLTSNTIEKLAKDKLGMQKLTTQQTIYISLPKKDYIEVDNEEITKEQEKNWFQKIVDIIFHR